MFFDRRAVHTNHLNFSFQRVDSEQSGTSAFYPLNSAQDRSCLYCKLNALLRIMLSNRIVST